MANVERVEDYCNHDAPALVWEDGRFVCECSTRLGVEDVDLIGYVVTLRVQSGAHADLEVVGRWRDGLRVKAWDEHRGESVGDELMVRLEEIEYVRVH